MGDNRMQFLSKIQKTKSKGALNESAQDSSQKSEKGEPSDGGKKRVQPANTMAKQLQTLPTMYQGAFDLAKEQGLVAGTFSSYIYKAIESQLERDGFLADYKKALKKNKGE